MSERLFIRAGATLCGFAALGPVGALAAWKFSGFATTGNLLHVVPGAGLVADGMEIVSEMAGDVGGLDQSGTRRRGNG